MSFRYTVQANLPPLAFLFPGQGSQTVGMGADLATHYPAAQAAFDEADEVLGFSLSQLCFLGPEEVLTDTLNAQPALLAASVAVLRALESELGSLPMPAFFAGHSMGEYTALVAAGALNYGDGLRLVRERGRLMKEAGEKTPGMMAAILALELDVVTQICAAAATATGGIAQVANDNCPGQIVISGEHRAMEAAMQAARDAKARKVVPLAVSIPAHSPLMAPAAAALTEALRAIEIIPPIAPIIGNTTAHPITAITDLQAELTAQLTESVRWTETVQTMVDAGVTTFVEIGPGDVLIGLVKRIDRKSNRISVSAAADVQNFWNQLST